MLGQRLGVAKRKIRASELLGRFGAAGALEALAPGTRGQADPAAGRAQAPRLPGEPGGRPGLGTTQQKLQEGPGDGALRLSGAIEF